MKNTEKATENAIRLIRKEITKLYVCGNYYPRYADKLAKWSAGFTVRELPNAKPGTIREATSDRGSVYYLAFLLKADATGKSYRRLNGGGWFEVGLYLTRTTNGNARALSFNRDKHIKNVWRNGDAESIRKNADKVFLIKAKPLYNDDDRKKQEQRKQNPAPKTRAEYEKDQYLYKVDRTLSNCKDAPDNAFYYSHGGYHYCGAPQTYYDRLYNNITERRAELRRKYAEVLKIRKKQELKQRNNTAERLEALEIIASCEKHYNDITFADIMQNPKNEQFKDELTTAALHTKKFIAKIDTFASVADMLARFNEIKSEYNNIIHLLKHRELIINNNFREVSRLKVIDNQIVDDYVDDKSEFWAERYIMRYDLEKGEILKGVSHYE